MCGPREKHVQGSSGRQHEEHVRHVLSRSAESTVQGFLQRTIVQAKPSSMTNRAQSAPCLGAQEGIPPGLVDAYVRQHLLRADQDKDAMLSVQVGISGAACSCGGREALFSWPRRSCACTTAWLCASQLHIMGAIGDIRCLSMQVRW